LQTTLHVRGYEITVDTLQSRAGDLLAVTSETAAFVDSFNWRSADAASVTILNRLTCDVRQTEQTFQMNTNIASSFCIQTVGNRSELNDDRARYAWCFRYHLACIRDDRTHRARQFPISLVSTSDAQGVVATSDLYKQLRAAG
jgi:hypothetical protein